MLKEWLVRVFWGDRARQFWTAGSILVAVIGATPYAENLGSLRSWIPLSLLIGGFLTSNFFIYRALRLELDRLTKQCSVSVLGLVTGEHTNLSTGRHALILDFVLQIKNRSGEDHSFELKRCECNVGGALSEMHYSGFVGEAETQVAYHGPPKIWTVKAKHQSKPCIKATFLLPENPNNITQNMVTGTLYLVDIHDREYRVEAHSPIDHTAPYSQP